MRLTKIGNIFIAWLFDINRLYITGICIWFIIWIILAGSYLLFSNKDDYVIGKILYNLLFLIPFIASSITLWWNHRLLSSPAEKENTYKEEVELIEFVERNSNYIILGISALLIASGFLLQKCLALLQSSYFLFFIGASLIAAICGVLPLIWMPNENIPTKLKWLRHFKTIWYTYSIYLFLAAIISIGKVWYFDIIVK